jgi:hypothetical protein
MAQYDIRQTFTVPATNGQYAAEVITLAGTADVPSRPLYAITALVETLGGATGAVVELWLLRSGGDPTNAAHYFNSGSSITSTGSNTWPLAAWSGAQLRVRSAGVASTASGYILSATAD